MDLCDALDVRLGDLIALVGGGGKTTALYRLGVELAARGRPVLLCGTTRFTPPEGREAPNLSLVGGPGDLHEAVAVGAWPLTVATGWGSKGRLLPLEPESIDALHRARPDLTVVIEADGSAMRPLKAPGEHEPVIPRDATLVVTVAGMDAAGRPLDQTHVHRPERVAALTGVQLGALITPEMIATVLCHPHGGRKEVPAGARWAVLLNKADTPARRREAELVAGAVRQCGARVVIAQVKREPPVLAALPANV